MSPSSLSGGIGAADGVPLVLHVIPTATARGAQREARALATRLDLPGTRHHRLMSLFAGEEQFPDIVNPIQMRWDARGRLWVSRPRASVATASRG